MKPGKVIMRAHPKVDAPASELITRYIADLGDWRGETMAKIRKAFRNADPAIVEEWKWMGSPVWSLNGQLAVANAHRDKVKVTFAHGAQLPDAHQLFNAGLGGRKWRAIDLFEGDDIDEYALIELIRAAITYNMRRSS